MRSQSLLSPVAVAALAAVLATSLVHAQTGVFIQWSSAGCTGNPQTWQLYQSTNCSYWPTVTAPEQMTCTDVRNGTGNATVLSVKTGCFPAVKSARLLDIQGLVAIATGSPQALVVDTFIGNTTCGTDIPYLVRTGYFADGTCQRVLTVTNAAGGAGAQAWTASGETTFVKMTCEGMAKCTDAACGSCQTLPVGRCLGENVTSVAGTTLIGNCISTALVANSPTGSTNSSSPSASPAATAAKPGAGTAVVRRNGGSGAVAVAVAVGVLAVLASALEL
ncbi:hypothetical protein M427DRAFT_31169 [Gonapodya prolifera JEL478]|uniref:Uncharacterized protein n=1 Tax=Gonapodya prolifera (strain JEL478) TaxID=1344416 RepID=A0A139AI71_GONPJ|nr:hypothetical protein M427DRAFT_31169 [Gonapodya prolifera JEL478]|eukprot:KXS16438.1 hypothetical protein M427DRAFT_31169 [Gonapodya prolifera JEL478]